jgi:Cu(I)/Ag(I) efflux system membrane protein CusA/SilA
MLVSIIERVIRFRALVWVLVAATLVLSAFAVRTASLDAIPDISDPQIIVYAKWGRSPQLIEAEITEPLIRALMGSPGIESIRGTTHLGYAFIYVVLNDASRREAVEQMVVDQIDALRPQVPSDAVITLGPNASSLGWIYQYSVVDETTSWDLRDLRLLNENTVKPALEQVAGVAEVASVGGLEKQYQLKIYPPLLASLGMSLRQVISSLQTVFQEVGGRTIEVTNRDYQLRGVVDGADVDKLEFLIVGRTPDGESVHLRDLGHIQIGYDLRRGIADLNGTGEVVGGIVIMEHEQNVLAVTTALERRLEEVNASLPDGLQVVATYNRSSLIWDTLKNFAGALAYELLVVVLVVVWALRNVRAAVAPVCVLLLGSLFTVLPMTALGQTINLLSLAGLAIAIGEMADATIVIVENCTAALSKQADRSYAATRQTIIHATAQMTRPLLFSLLIIVASFLPIFFLEEREGRLFDPLAYSKTFAMAFSTLLTLFVLPVIIIWIFKNKAPVVAEAREGAWVRLYRLVLGAILTHRYAFTTAGLIVLGASLWLAAGFQKDYMPEMEEGSVLYMPTTVPGLPAQEAGWILQQIDRKLSEFPEVERAFGKLGRADTSTDPAPMTMIETTVMLKPQSEWRDGLTKDALVAEMDEALQIVGYVNTWTQPIAGRVMMQDTGIQTPVGIKVRGPDIEQLELLSSRIEGLLREFPGTQSVIAERIADGYYVDVRQDLERMAEHGVTVDEAMLTVRHAVGGENVASVKQPDNSSIPLSVQYSPEYVDTLEKIRNVPVVTADRQSVALGQIADVSVRRMPEMIRNDNGQLAGYVYVDLDNVTPADYVATAQPFLEDNLQLPNGYSVEWTGTYRYAADAQRQLLFIVPITLMIVFVLLMMAFRSWSSSLLIMFSAPFALIGGLFLQWMLGYSMTTAVIIGYISLLAVAVQTGIIMVEFIHQALARRTSEQTYMDAVIEGSVARLRPKLMTVATTVLGLLPIMLATGSGMDITQPIATPTFGGMISSTVYVLFLIPCLFVIGDDIRRRWWGRGAAQYAQPQMARG